MKLLPKANPQCPYCNNPSKKKGFKKNKQRIIQRYLCKSCNKSFTSQHPTQKSKTYPLKTILTAISSYNLGTPLRKITSQNKEAIPSSTILNWIKTINLPMNRLRNKIKNIPKHNIIIKQKFIHHKQPFLYQYHSLKLDFAKKFPTLLHYLTNLDLPKNIFENSKRISETSRETPTKGGDEQGVAPFGVASRISNEVRNPSPAIGLVGVSKLSLNNEITQKQNYAVELAKLAAAITKDNKQRHNIIENFMLTNDTATIAAEVPVYFENFTGHIDILQIRFHKLYILDYKPEPINKQQTINQLKLYRKALSKRTSIPEHKFKLAFFNDTGYYEIN